MTSWGEALEAAEAATSKRCEADPNFDAVHQMLVKWEMEAHRRQWDHPLNMHSLFEVVRAPRPRSDVALNARAAVGVRFLLIQERWGAVVLAQPPT